MQKNFPHLPGTGDTYSKGGNCFDPRPRQSLYEPDQACILMFCSQASPQTCTSLLPRYSWTETLTVQYICIVPKVCHIWTKLQGMFLSCSCTRARSWNRNSLTIYHDLQVIVISVTNPFLFFTCTVHYRRKTQSSLILYCSAYATLLYLLQQPVLRFYKCNRPVYLLLNFRPGLLISSEEIKAYNFFFIFLCWTSFKVFRQRCRLWRFRGCENKDTTSVIKSWTWQYSKSLPFML